MAGESVLATQAKLELEQTDRVVLAEGALRREQIVAWARIAAIVGWASTMSVVGGLRDSAPDWWRMGIGGLYLVNALLALYGVRRALRETRTGAWLRRVQAWSVATPVIDTAFNVALLTAPVPAGADLHTLPALHAERAAVTFALLTVLAVARTSWPHVAWSVALALLGYFFTIYTPYYRYGHVGPRPLSEGETDLEWPISSVYITVGYCLLGFIVAQAQRLLREDFTRLRRLSNLKRFLPSQIAERVYAGGDEALRPVSREVTVMFTDIRDFTSQSEKMQPHEVLRFLNDYFGHMTQIVKGHDGVVSKFIGDGMLAFWGVPEANAKHAEGAVRAALDMRKKLVELNAARANEQLPPIHIGVGVHTGMVAAGLLGRADAPLSEYTVIGDAVNLASRIEGLTKKMGTDVLVSEEAWRATAGRFAGERLGEEHVKGREHPVVVYRVDAVLPS